MPPKSETLEHGAAIGMMSKNEIRAWVDTLPEDAEVGIDEGGLCLQVRGSEAYLEVGGFPEGD